MSLHMIIGPVVGAVIGYCTNFIAVKMLFVPYEEKKIFGKRIPFTPGMIPKEKPRLAKAVGDVVETNLLTEETISQSLLTEEIKGKIRDEVAAFMDRLKQDDTQLRAKLGKLLSEETVAENESNIKNLVTDKIYNNIMDMNIGEVVSEKVVDAVKSKLQGGFLAMMLNDSVIESFVGPVSEMIDGYVAENGRSLIYDKVSDEIDTILAADCGTLAKKASLSNVDISELVVRAYETFVKTKLKDILKAVNISGIIEDKINEMDVREAEELLLSVMKKELNAIVNLGALIGFVLGIVMIFIK